jgi:tight adherence protein B
VSASDAASSGAIAVAIAAGGASAGALACLAGVVATRDAARVRGALVDEVAAPGPRPRGSSKWSGPALRVAASMIAGWLGMAVAGPGGALAGAVACLALPVVRRRRRSRAELAALEEGLAEAVSAMAAAMRAGRSMTGAFEEAASTVPPPLGPRLAALVDRVTLGVPLETAVLELAGSLPGSDGRLVAAVLGLHQRAGGDAPAVLDRVARTLRERRASAREVRALTAQARLSGAILGFLPMGFFLFLSLTARADVERALDSAAGVTAISVGLAMQGIAYVWIRRLLRVET